MGFFSLDSPHEPDLAWRLVVRSPIWIYRDLSRLQSHLAELAGDGYECHLLDCTGWREAADCYRAIAEARAVAPVPTNINWFIEEMEETRPEGRDPVVPEGGLVLAFANFDRCPYAGLFANDFAELARTWLLVGRIWITLVHSDDPGFKLGPVAALEVAGPWQWPSDPAAPQH